MVFLYICSLLLPWKRIYISREEDRLNNTLFYAKMIGQRVKWVFYFVWAINCQIDYKYSSADFYDVKIANWYENRARDNRCVFCVVLICSLSHTKRNVFYFFTVFFFAEREMRVGVEVDLVMLMMALMTWWLDEALMVNLKSWQ